MGSGCIVRALDSGRRVDKQGLFVFAPRQFLSFLSGGGRVRLSFMFMSRVCGLSGNFVVSRISRRGRQSITCEVTLRRLLGAPRISSLLANPCVTLPAGSGGSTRFSFGAFLSCCSFTVIGCGRCRVIGGIRIFTRATSAVRVSGAFRLAFAGGAGDTHVIRLIARLLGQKRGTVICYDAGTSARGCTGVLVDGGGCVGSISSRGMVELAGRVSDLFTGKEKTR